MMSWRSMFYTKSLLECAQETRYTYATIREWYWQELDQWLESAFHCVSPELHAFERKLRQDQAAVQAGLTLMWSNALVGRMNYCLELLNRIVSWGFSFFIGEAGFKRIQSLKEHCPLTYIGSAPCHYVCHRQTYGSRIRASLIQYNSVKQAYLSKRSMYSQAKFILLRQRIFS